jgi:hypothetical protein
MLSWTVVGGAVLSKDLYLTIHWSHLLGGSPRRISVLFFAQPVDAAYLELILKKLPKNVRCKFLLVRAIAECGLQCFSTNHDIMANYTDGHSRGSSLPVLERYVQTSVALGLLSPTRALRRSCCKVLGSWLMVLRLQCVANLSARRHAAQGCALCHLRECPCH